MADAPPDGETDGDDRPALRVGHLGICVRDLGRSLRFYTEGLGFVAGMGIDLGDEWAATLEVSSEVRLRSQFLAKDGLTVELLAFTSPAPEGEPASRRNQVGMTHLSVHVDDIDRAADRLVAAGGSVLEHTRTTLRDRSDAVVAEFVFCSDPDGVRIELMRP